MSNEHERDESEIKREADRRQTPPAGNGHTPKKAEGDERDIDEALRRETPRDNR